MDPKYTQLSYWIKWFLFLAVGAIVCDQINKRFFKT